MTETNTIYADTYSATTQAVSDAIDLSAEHDEIVRIVAGRNVVQIAAELAESCDGCTDCQDGHDYWGTIQEDDETPLTWRVILVDVPAD